MSLLSADSRPSVFVVGDSISVHYGPFLEKALAGRIAYNRKGGAAEALANLDVPRGSNGGDSGRVLNFLRERLSEPDFRPGLLLFNAGLHDIKRRSENGPPQIELDQYRANLRQIVEALRSRKIAPAWIRTTPLCTRIHNGPSFPGFFRFEPDLEQYNRVADEVMEEEKIPSINLYHFTLTQADDPAELFCDHVHFHLEIQARQGAFLSGWIFSYFSAAGFTCRP